MSGEITVTMPLKQYEQIKKDAKERDVGNFISRDYTNFEKNEFKLIIHQEAVNKMFGRIVQNYSDNVSEILMENLRMRLLLKEISETPITRGISPVEKTLQKIVSKANVSLLEHVTGLELREYQKDVVDHLNNGGKINES